MLKKGFDRSGRACYIRTGGPGPQDSPRARVQPHPEGVTP